MKAFANKMLLPEALKEIDHLSSLEYTIGGNKNTDENNTNYNLINFYLQAIVADPKILKLSTRIGFESSSTRRNNL